MNSISRRSMFHVGRRHWFPPNLEEIRNLVCSRARGDALRCFVSNRRGMEFKGSMRGIPDFNMLGECFDRRPLVWTEFPVAHSFTERHRVITPRWHTGKVEVPISIRAR